MWNSGVTFGQGDSKNYLRQVCESLILMGSTALHGDRLLGKQC